ncbi:MAG: hypothetical protein HY954_03655 [Deltaproteobacteria bacterium]|nr:hypothetical protein [Deltaproteobacteria bacterium]
MVWILLALLANGIISFAYTVSVAPESATLWAMLSTTFLFYLGITQTGIIFSAFMRIAKSEWGKLFSRIGEILTLSFIPVAFVTFIIIYIGGTDHLFYWAKAAAPAHGEHSAASAAHHISPWLRKDLFLWRTLISMAAFYIMSYVYFATARTEEKGHGSACIESKLNIMAGFVMFFFVATNTNTAWDFGMMIIQHWESTIFPPYYWVSNVFAGVAFLFIFGNKILAKYANIKLEHRKETLDFMGIMLLGFTLTWIYMFWSQHIVIWYGDFPALTKPLIDRMSGNYFYIFILMLVTVFLVPFLAFLYRRVKLSINALLFVAFVICIGVWISRYLMIIPVFSDGSENTFLSWTGVALILSGLSATIISFLAFLKLFPGVSITTFTEKHGDH